MSIRWSLLCPVDFSPASLGALHYALAIARRFRVAMTVLTVDDRLLADVGDARMGDGWLNNITDPNTYKECLGKIRAYAADAGRDPQAVEPGLYFTLAAGDDRAIREGEQFLSQYYNRPYDAVAKAMLCVMGNWDRVIDQIQAYAEAGARTVVLRFATSDQIRHLEECAEQLARRGFPLGV